MGMVCFDTTRYLLKYTITNPKERAFLSIFPLVPTTMASTAASSSNDIHITLTHRGLSYPITTSSSSLLEDLQAEIEEVTHVPVGHQKLLYKHKKASRHTTDDHHSTVEDAGIRDGTKVMLVGGTREEVGGVQREEDEAKRKERIDRERRAKPQAKVRDDLIPFVPTCLMFCLLASLDRNTAWFLE